MTQDEVENTGPSREPLLACSGLFLEMVGKKDPKEIKGTTSYFPKRQL